jgi:hypothetical protein
MWQVVLLSGDQEDSLGPCIFWTDQLQVVPPEGDGIMDTCAVICEYKPQQGAPGCLDDVLVPTMIG